MQFDGSCVVVTGASGNLGRALERVLSARGATLVLVASHREGLERAFGEAGPRRLYAPADLQDPDALAGVVAAAGERFGRIHALCNLVGGFAMGKPVHETSDADWSAMFVINAKTLLHASAAVVPAMVAGGGGRIVNVGAFGARGGAALMGPYVAAKAAVQRITETMSAELREQGINVNCVLPGTIDTPQNRSAMPQADTGRWVAPDDLARAIAFLASEDARAIHGVALPVTGLG